MEQLLSDIEAYAKAVNKGPQAGLRAAIGAGWKEWESWKTGASSPTMARVDRLRAYMAENPPSAGVSDPREDAA